MKNPLIMLLGGVLGLFVGASCGDNPRAIGEGESCYPSGTWDLQTWCDYPAADPPQKGELHGVAIFYATPIPEDGCSACDAEMIADGLEEAANEACPGGYAVFEDGCAAPRGEDQCGYYAFVWGETCSAT